METLTELLDQKQVASLWTAAFDNRKDTEVGGEVKASDNPLVLRLGLGGRKFVTEMPLSTWQSLGSKRQGVAVAAWVGDHRELRAPNGWQAALMLAIPLAVAAAVGRFHMAGKGIGLPFNRDAKRSAPAPARAAGSRG